MSSPRLLRTLHNAYRPGRETYDKEDLFSEYLVWLLDRSSQFRVAFAELALKDSADVNPDVFREAEPQSQVRTNRGWQVDLVLRVNGRDEGTGGHRGADDTALLVIECKIESGFGTNQLERYHRWLEDEANRYRHLALTALTKRQLDRKSLLSRQEYPYWQENMYWHQVAKTLEGSVEAVRSERLPTIDPEEEEFFEPAGFVVIGDEFQDLMGEEGMVATSFLDAENAADMYHDYEAYTQRLDDMLHLVERALDTAGVRKLLREKADGDDLRTERRKPYKKGRPVSLIYHRENPPACFMFGVTVSPPNTYARRPGETVPEAYEAELIVGYKLLSESEGGLSWPREALEEVAKIVQAAVRDRADRDLEIFVPENTSYQKWVARPPVPDAENADEQARMIGEIYRTFVKAFTTAETPDGRSLLADLRTQHRSAVAES